MKCALELKILKKEAIINWLNEEAKKDEQARNKYKIACEDTIAFCENQIDNALTQKALNRHKIKSSWKIEMSKDRVDNQLFQLIERDGRKYANGKDSYCAYGKYYSWETLVNYLKANCLEIRLEDDSYDWYGFGTRKCFTMEIFVTE